MRYLLILTLSIFSFVLTNNVVAQTNEVMAPSNDPSMSTQANESGVQGDPNLVDQATDAPVVPPVAEVIPPNFNSPITATGDQDLFDVVNRINKLKPNINLDHIPSLFLTPSEESLIQEARLGMTTRAPTDYELSQAESGSVVMGPREIALGGIVFLSSNDWTIWLNGQKITPQRIPPEVTDIDVYKNFIKVKWFDAYTNQIFPIKLRTHQRFNIDTRIFLPGESTTDVMSAN